MRLRRLPELAEGAEALDAPGDALSTVVSRLVPPGPLKDALSGTWLGHALHPVMTDLPIGFWTSSLMVDLFGGRRGDAAARKLVGWGVVAALPTAAAGLSDWADTAGGEKRVGVVHAMANSVALACYSASWLARRKGRRGAGVVLGVAGGAAATVGGYLGGHLVNGLGVGVDNTAFEDGPQEWTPVGGADQLEAGRPLAVDAGGVRVLVVQEGEDLYGLSDRCTHRGGPLHEGEVADGCVSCPWHGSVFRLRDGEVTRGPAALPQPRYEVRVREGRLEVRRFALAAP